MPNLGIFSHFFLQLFFSALPSSSPPSGTRTTQMLALSIPFCRFLRLFTFLEVSLPLFFQIGNIQRSIFKCPPPPIISIMLMSRSQGVFYVNDCPFYFQSCHWVLYIFYFFADLFYLSIHTPKAEGEDLRQDRLERASDLVLEVAAQPSRQQGSPLVWSGWSGSLGKWQATPPPQSAREEHLTSHQGCGHMPWGSRVHTGTGRRPPPPTLSLQHPPLRKSNWYLL